jgi:hypothetical protein
MFSDSNPGHFGISATDSATTTLYRDGVEVGTFPVDGFGQWSVPTEPASYRLATTVSRSVSELSTRIDAEWTFQSTRAAGAGRQALPLMVVRFAPALDPTSSARAGRPFTVPLYLQRQQGARYGALRTLTVEVSYDDGATWVPTRLTGSGDHRRAQLRHPNRNGYVSLRARALDAAGNEVRQTILRAYRITTG